MTHAIGHAIINRKLPVWDASSKKMYNHYKQEEFLNTLSLLDGLCIKAEMSGEVITSVVLARLISKMYRPPKTMLTWTKRVMAVYQSKEVLSAVIGGVVSSRYALCELANRIGDARYASIVTLACEGKLNGTQFRVESKLIQGNNE